MGLAVIEASACDVPAFGTPVGAHPVVARRDRGLGVPRVGRRALARGAAPAPRGGGPARRRPRRPRSASRPTAWPRAWWRRGARRLLEEARVAADLYSLRRGARRVPDSMSGLLRRIRRPGAAEETRTEPIALPEPAHGSAPTPPTASPPRTGAPCPPASAPRTSSAAATTGRRGKLRRRARFLRRARELALRDLGGLVYEARRRRAGRRQARRGEGRSGSARSTRSCASLEAELGDAARRDRAARARRRRHLPALRRAARERRPLLLALRPGPESRSGSGRARSRRTDGAGRAGGRRDQRSRPRPRRPASAEPAAASPRRAARHGRGAPERRRPRRSPPPPRRQPRSRAATAVPRRPRPPPGPSPQTPPTATAPRDRSRRSPARHRAGVPALRRVARARPGVVPELRHRRRHADRADAALARPGRCSSARCSR